MGIWEVRVYHFDKIDGDKGHAIAFKMNDLDAKRGCLPKAFERAVDAVKNSIGIEEKKKNAKK